MARAHVDVIFHIKNNVIMHSWKWGYGGQERLEQKRGWGGGGGGKRERSVSLSELGFVPHFLLKEKQISRVASIH